MALSEDRKIFFITELIVIASVFLILFLGSFFYEASYGNQ